MLRQVPAGQCSTLRVNCRDSQRLYLSVAGWSSLEGPDEMTTGISNLLQQQTGKTPNQVDQ